MSNIQKEVESLRNDQLIQITETIEDIEDKIQEVYESKKKRLPMASGTPFSFGFGDAL